MSYLSIDEMKSYLYTENVDVITRSDDTIVTAAIDTAISEAKCYLGAYDCTTIFNTTDSNRNQLLLTMIKDCAAWHLMKLSNAGVNYEYRKKIYDRAIKWLEDVQRSKAMPDLPSLEDEDGTLDVNQVRYGSNTKKEQKF